MNNQPALKLSEILKAPEIEPARENPDIDASVCFARHQDELHSYLVQRFGSVALAERVVPEARARLSESDVLLLVGNPRVYMMGYALSLGLQFLQEDAAQFWYPERES